MVTRQNPPDGITQLHAVLDDAAELVMLEGRPALYEAPEAAERARNRTPRPNRHTVAPVDQLVAGGRVILSRNRSDRPNPSPVAD